LSEKYLKYFILFLLLLGIILRLTYYFQDYDLIIDEANIARNLDERNFGELCLPLKYEQYAPPVFLWIEKLMSLIFGFGEKALRLYPLLCGIAALFVFHKILVLTLSRKAFWYPLALLAMGVIYVKYSAQVKQYMPDLLIGLLLIWATLSIDILKVKRNRFILFWVIAGSVAVWSSMSSVFILAGVGTYYAWQLWKEKKWNMVWIILIPVLTWIGNFLLYYILILKPQINSDYLQNYHNEYFLFLFPGNKQEWMHNGNRLLSIVRQMGGFTFLPVIFNVLLLLIGTYQVLKTKKELIWLFGLPILLVIVAAALRQYSLIERLILFVLPLGLVLTGFGMQKLMEMKSVALQMVVGLVALVTINNAAMLRILWRYEGFHEMTFGMSYLKEHHVDGNHLYVHDGCGPTYIYYTQLHPAKKEWESLLGAKILKWDSDYAVETKDIRDTVYFIYTGGFPLEERNKRTSQIEQNMKQVDYFEKYICYVYGYAPKNY
jgi:4-amino-4-deoxy-L-arabinose transferase-like glycosyltransferase